jgi:hypothetical protein
MYKIEIYEPLFAGLTVTVLLTTSTLPVHKGIKSKKTRILLFLFSLSSHPSAVSYDPRAIVWHPDARQTAQTSSRWLFTALQCPTTASSHRALPWLTAPQNRPTQATVGAPDPAMTTQKARGPAESASSTRRASNLAPRPALTCRGRGFAC